MSHDNDLRRRLEKLVALRDHPSTLPAIRDEATKASERLRARMDECAQEGAAAWVRGGPEGYRRWQHNRARRDIGHLWEDDWLMGINRETAKIWKKVKPARPPIF